MEWAPSFTQLRISCAARRTLSRRDRKNPFDRRGGRWNSWHTGALVRAAQAANRPGSIEVERRDELPSPAPEREGFACRLPSHPRRHRHDGRRDLARFAGFPNSERHAFVIVSRDFSVTGFVKTV
jgi:hypothetical protein